MKAVQEDEVCTRIRNGHSFLTWLFQHTWDLCVKALPTHLEVLTQSGSPNHLLLQILHPNL